MWNGVITNAGAALLASWAAAGGTLKIEAAWAGSGTVGTFEMISQTGLLNPMHRLSMVGKNKIEKGTRLHLQHVAANTAYVATQLGIFARLDDGESTLIALYQDETGVDIPAVSEMPDFVYVFFTSLIFDNTGDFSVNVDSTALVSYAALEERMKSFEVTVDNAVTIDGANAVSGAAVYAFVNEGLEGKAEADHNHSALYYNATIKRDANTVLAAPNGQSGAATFRRLVAADIPSLAAPKITSGTFDAARIPSLDASKISAGTLAGKVQANASAAAEVSVPQLRDIVMTTTDPGAGATVSYPDGTVIHVYE